MKVTKTTMISLGRLETFFPLHIHSVIKRDGMGPDGQAGPRDWTGVVVGNGHGRGP